MIVISCVTIRSEILQRLATTSGNGIEDAALSLLALRNSGRTLTRCSERNIVLALGRRFLTSNRQVPFTPRLRFWQFDRFKPRRSDVPPGVHSSG